MGKLTPEQIALIEKALVKQGLIYPPLRDEVLDHVASLIEADIKNGLNFETTLRNALNNFGRAELQTLQIETIKALKSGDSIRKEIFGFGLAGGLVLCLWVFVEFLTGVFFDMPELGRYYGLLSVAILLTVIIIGVKRIRDKKLEGFITYIDAVKHGLRITLFASIWVTFFWIFYYNFINPDFYQTYQMNAVNVSPDKFVTSSIIGGWIGVLAEGGLLSLLMAAFLKNNPPKI